MLNSILWWQTDCMCTTISRNSKKNKTGVRHTATVNSQWPFWFNIRSFCLACQPPSNPPIPGNIRIVRLIDWLQLNDWTVFNVVLAYFSEVMMKLKNIKVIVPTVAVYFFSKCHNTENSCKQIQEYIFKQKIDQYNVTHAHDIFTKK